MVCDWSLPIASTQPVHTRGMRRRKWHAEAMDVGSSDESVGGPYELASEVGGAFEVMRGLC